MKLTKKEINFIKPEGVARLATVGRDGVPHNVPVCPLFDRGKVYVATEKGAKKVRNIEANPHATIVFDHYRASWTGLRGVMLQCTVRIVGEKEFKSVRQKFYTKYRKYKSASPIEADDSLILELDPETKFSWGLNG
jgi:nitroimidazol reductase NimA-like FMN-containing flavoprotein (pyridoxamine 5'-phosphate oxidase superfamily)